MIAFKDFKRIESIIDIHEQHREWLKDYEGLNYSFAEDGKHKRKWAMDKLEYKNSDWKPSLNCMARKPNRTIIEFDDDEEKNKQSLELTIKKLKERGFGYIESTHGGNSNYLWVEFTRKLTDKEVKSFLKWICPSGSTIDTNFASSKKVFAVLYANHWKHSNNKEMPIEYFEGNQIDFDSLGITKLQTKPKKNFNFNYETYTKQDLENIKPLELSDITYFQNLKPEKHQIIEGIIGKEALSMWYSPPKHLKSVISLYAGMCVSTGKKFLGQKTKKYPVLIIDLENNEEIKRERLLQIKAGMGIRGKPKIFYLSRGEAVDVFSDIFIARVGKTIKEHGIKLIILDTFRRMSPEMKENASDDVSNFHRKFFIPLRDEYGISCIFLHHTDKGERGYRGSSDIGGMVDTSFLIKKTGKGSKPSFKIEADLIRRKAIEKLLGVVELTDKAIIFEKRVIDEEAVVKKETYIEILNHIRDFIKNAKPTEVKKQSIKHYLEEKGFDVENKRRQIDNALNFLIENGEADTDKKGRYWGL